MKNQSRRWSRVAAGTYTPEIGSQYIINKGMIHTGIIPLCVFSQIINFSVIILGGDQGIGACRECWDI